MAGGGTPEHRRAARRYPFGMLCKTDCPRGPSLLCPGPARAGAGPAPTPAPARRKGAGNTVIGRARPITVTAQTAGTNGRPRQRAPAQTALRGNGRRGNGPMYTPRVPPGGAALLVRGGGEAATAGAGGGYLSSWVSLRRLFSISLSPRMKAGLPRTVCT